MALRAPGGTIRRAFAKAAPRSITRHLTALTAAAGEGAASPLSWRAAEPGAKRYQLAGSRQPRNRAVTFGTAAKRAGFAAGDGGACRRPSVTPLERRRDPP